MNNVYYLKMQELSDMELNNVSSIDLGMEAMVSDYNTCMLNCNRNTNRISSSVAELSGMCNLECRAIYPKKQRRNV